MDNINQSLTNDISMDVDVSSNEYVFDNFNDGVFSASNDDNEVISTEVSGSFNNLISAISSSSQIRLTGDVSRLNGEDDIYIRDGKTVSIDGNGHTINANKLGRAFIVSPKATLYLSNVKIINCDVYKSGYTSTYEGGAILNLQGSLIMSDCTFENNFGGNGGAIGATMSAFTSMSGTNVFSGNSVDHDGGAISNIGGSILNITGKVIFTNNNAVNKENDGKAGAILNAFENAHTIIDAESLFKDNTAALDGGAIFNHQAVLDIMGTNEFTNNRATGSWDVGKGGAINSENATLRISGTNTFTSNHAGRGGAIDSNYASKFVLSGKNTFTSNSADLYGGAIANFLADTFISSADNTFTSNTAGEAGGAIHSYKTPVTFSGINSFLKNNAAISGGAIHLGEAPSVSFSNHCYFDDNHAMGNGGSGGAIYASSGGTLDLKGMVFSGNSAVYGGAVHVNNNPLTASYNIFHDNSATGSGNDIEVFNSNVGTFDMNYWGSQSRPTQERIHNYNVGNIASWVILQSIIPSEITQGKSTNLVRFVQNSGSVLSSEMGDFHVSVSPNFNPESLTVSKNIGSSTYNGNVLGAVTVALSARDFSDSRTVNVISAAISTTLLANDVLLFPGENGNYIVTLKDKNEKALAGQNIRIVFNGRTSTLTTDNKGQVSLPVSGSTGHYDINAFFDGKDNYLSSNKSNYVVVFSNDSNNSQINANNISMLYKDGTRFVATLTDMNNNPLKNVKMGFVINNITYMRDTNDKGQASIPLNLVANEYNVLSYFIGDGNYLPVLTENTVVIGSTISASDIVKYYKNDTQYTATFRNSDGSYLAKGTQVDFNINGVHYHRSIRDDMGNTLFNINLGPGKYILTAINANGEQIASNIEVLTVFDEHNDIVKYYKNATQYCVSLLDGSGNPIGAGASVEFNINGVFYTRTTNESGIAKMNINLGEGDYIITATYNGLAVSNNIKVLPVMFGNDMVKKYSDVAAYEVRLINGVGDIYPNQTITFNINGVFYNRTTGDDGIARLNIRLINGEYIITSEYNGFLISNTVTVTP